MYRKTLTAILAAGLALSSGIPAEAGNHASNEQSDHALDNKVIKKIDSENMYQHIEVLSQQPREAGTDGEWQGVQYIKEQFESFGYKTEIQPFEFNKGFKRGTPSIILNGNDFAGDVHTFTGSINAEVEAPLVYVGLASEGEVGDEVAGKIALIERGEISFYDKIQNVLDKGAAGVIMFNREGTTGNQFGGIYEGQDIPAVAVTREAGLELVDRLATEEVIATVSVEGASYIKGTSHNVIAKKKPHPNKDNGQIVMVGAHHDSVSVGPGANDDASGVAAVLELARVMANTPTDTELRFATYGAEEKGLVGSYDYAYSLSDEEVQNIVGHFQLDMVGSRDAGELIMFTPNGEKNLVTDYGAAAGARVSETVPYGQLGRSDHVPFYERGIPAALFIHAPLEPWYHGPEDTIDKISKEKLQDVGEIVGAAVYQIARPDTPALEHANVAPGTVEYDFDDRPL
ncbi:aminopeptidase YwaD [Thalassobacillus cyri]|uniref:Aminopeptidase YwaD n=1 Tax=Thalassobacillus cyri TaxID=571932 RepID=A0A1H3XXZ5_9BACI|nr:M28 family peptidase [Thalassobacillus cyri]SEA04337.1 aminopeptidase YwaD [Thalassobacillus cyri]